MSSKLDQLRDQFRERLRSRPIGETKIPTIKVKDSNNNNMDLKFPKSELYFGKNSILNPIKYVSQNDNQKGFNNLSNLSKVNSNKLEESNQFSFNRRKQNLPKFDSNTFGKKVYSNKETKRSPQLTSQWINKERNPETFLSDSITEGTACRYCQRRFALTERLEKHESVCMSSLDKSRIKFNSFEQRVKGQPNDYLLIYENALKKESNEPKASNWRQKHQYFIAAIRTAKGGEISGPTPSQIMASIQQQCDYCKRRFNEEAIKRHLPICAKLHHKKLLKI